MHVLLQALIIAGCGLLAVFANPVIRALLRHINPPQPNPDPTILESWHGLPGGRWIGMLERAATYACIVAGFPAGLAFILAVKGLGRYPELRNGDDPRLGEVFIIGTFASMLWACAFAGIAYALVRL
uniref:hypothetical protein n=1 Tax=Tessaracoccus timonensis TaxID=2161816 RepID=UPI000D5541BD|nr:hypothetical protein [Tessaracoccus timonensis]